MTSQLKDLGNAKGVLGLIPKEWRQAGAGIASAIADPLDQMADAVQDQANKIAKEFPQTEAGASTMSEVELKEASSAMADEIIRQRIRAEVAQALTNKDWWSWVPADQRWWMRPILNMTNPLGN